MCEIAPSNPILLLKKTVHVCSLCDKQNKRDEMHKKIIAWGGHSNIIMMLLAHQKNILLLLYTQVQSILPLITTLVQASEGENITVHSVVLWYNNMYTTINNFAKV